MGNHACFLLRLCIVYMFSISLNTIYFDVEVAEGVGGFLIASWINTVAPLGPLTAPREKC